MSQVHLLAQLWVIVSDLCIGEITGCVSAESFCEKSQKNYKEKWRLFSK